MANEPDQIQDKGLKQKVVMRIKHPKENLFSDENLPYIKETLS